MWLNMSTIDRYVKYTVPNKLEPNLIGAGDLVNNYVYKRDQTAKKNKVGTLNSKQTSKYYDYILTQLQVQDKTHISKKDIDAVLLATSQFFIEKIIFEDAKHIHIPFLGYFSLKQRHFGYKPHYLKFKFEQDYGKLFRSIIRAVKDKTFKIPQKIFNRGVKLLNDKIKDYLISNGLIDTETSSLSKMETTDTLIVN